MKSSLAAMAAPGATTMSWSDRWFRLRNRVLSDPRFQRWAARFPLTRAIARRRASALFDLCAGFVYSQVLFAAVRVGLLEALSTGPRTIPELAPSLSLSTAATLRLLEAAASLRLVERRGHSRYGLGVHGASFMGNPAIGKMVQHHALLYRDLEDPVALLRDERVSTELSQFWSYARRSSAAPAATDVAAYSDLMAGSMSLVADDVIEAYSLTRHRRLLDIGGGDGAFLEAVARRSPHLELVLFDLPAVARRAEERLGRAGLAERARVVGGDALCDPLPEGADVLSLVRVIHDHDDAQALRILRAARTALPRRGALLLAEPMAGTYGAEAMGDAYFGFYLLAMGQGRARRAGELCEMLARAGFDRVELRKTRRPMLCRLIVAHVD